MSEEHPEGPVVRDKRRLDPQTGAVRESAAAPAPGAAASPPVSATGGPTAADAVGSLADLQQRVAERTADLQRLQAEFANYRRRVERDRDAVREVALAGVLAEVVPVLDDIGRAREHDELDGAFKAIAEALETTLTKLGLARFGEPGERFDPKVHEALMHTHSAEVTEPTCVQVFQPGYRVGERVLRAARVAVADPEPGVPPAAEPPDEPDATPA